MVVEEVEVESMRPMVEVLLCLLGCLPHRDVGSIALAVAESPNVLGMGSLSYWVYYQMQHRSHSHWLLSVGID